MASFVFAKYLMKKRLLYGLCVFCLLSAAGCGANIPPTHYYTFQPDFGKTTEVQSSRYPVVIGVNEYEADVPYQQDNMVFRTSAYEVNFYEYHKWLRPPAELVTKQVYKLFASSGKFQKVHTSPFDMRSDYIMQGRIMMFDQWYNGETSTVQIGIQHQLIALENEQVVWMDTIETTAAVSSLGIVETVKGFEAALQKNIQQAITAIDGVFAEIY